MANEFVSINSDVIETVIGSKTKFKGTVKTDKPIRIDGVFEGTIDTTNLVLVSEGGRFNGTMTCRELDLIGEARGKINCTEVLKFALSGRLIGDVETANVDIHPGSYYDGTLKIIKA